MQTEVFFLCVLKCQKKIHTVSVDWHRQVLCFCMFLYVSVSVCLYQAYSFINYEHASTLVLCCASAVLRVTKFQRCSCSNVQLSGFFKLRLLQRLSLLRKGQYWLRRDDMQHKSVCGSTVQYTTVNKIVSLDVCVLQLCICEIKTMKNREIISAFQKYCVVREQRVLYPGLL